MYPGRTGYGHTEGQGNSRRFNPETIMCHRCFHARTVQRCLSASVLSRTRDYGLGDSSLITTRGRSQLSVVAVQSATGQEGKSTHQDSNYSRPAARQHDPDESLDAAHTRRDLRVAQDRGEAGGSARDLEGASRSFGNDGAVCPEARASHLGTRI